MEVSNFLCFALYSASRSMTQLYRAYLDPLDLTYPQFLVLVSLWNRDNRNVSDLCDELLLDTGTLTPLLKRLETKGLLTRSRSKLDERIVEIRLTKSGRAMESHLGTIAKNMLCDLDMSVDQVAKMAQKIQTIRTQIDKKTAST